MVSASFIPLGTLLFMGAFGASVLVAVSGSLAVATVLLVWAGWAASRASGWQGWRLLPLDASPWEGAPPCVVMQRFRLSSGRPREST